MMPVAIHLQSDAVFCWITLSFCEIHVVASYLLHHSSAKIAVPHSIDLLLKSHHSSSDFLESDDSDDCSSIISLIELLGTKILGLRQ